jgi:PrmC N-terminal domain
MTGLMQALRDSALRLSHVSETPRLDAELLMAYALGRDRSDVLLRQTDLVVPDEFAGLIDRRIAHEPVAYITGRQAFWDLELAVTPDVLIPRADSETLIEAALEGPEPVRVLDLGTGSGALLRFRTPPVSALTPANLPWQWRATMAGSQALARVRNGCTVAGATKAGATGWVNST